MKHRFGLANTKLLLGFILLLMIVTVFSCDSSDQLGLEITPPGESFDYHLDSSTVLRMTTLAQDSLTTERRNPVLIGSSVDDVFGSQQASLATQLRLTSNDVDFGNNVELDSAVLLLKYHSFYGDTTTLQNLKVYELNSDLYYDSTYYSNIDLSEYFDENNPVGEIAFYPSPSTDSLTVRLDDEFGQMILEADTSHLKDPSSFLEFMKGLYITTDEVSSGGAISYFDVAGGKSRVTLYYSNIEDDSLSYEILINDNCSWINSYSHDYEGVDLRQVINDSLYSHDVTYLQGTSGLRAGLQITFSDTLLAAAEKGIAINKAQLILPVAQEYVNDIRVNPASLAVYRTNADGTNEFIEDIFLGEEYYDGGYHSDKGAYVFNIVRHIQNLLNPEPASVIENRGLFLVINEARTNANSLVLKNQEGNNAAHIDIIYTLIK